MRVFASVKLILDAARARDRLDEQPEDYRPELAEYLGIAEAEQRTRRLSSETRMGPDGYSLWDRFV
ncbi:hypothetical protein AEYBE204_09570 [Asticcacaulis sp. YBE204]|nr:hypothetical protein AEYBE204_09570 [Asticcacaulis sp. YBE204]